MELFDAIATNDVGRVFVTTHALVTQGADPRQLAFGALAHARSLLLLRSAPDAGTLLEVAEDDLAALETQSQSITGATLLRILDLLGKAITEMRNAPNHRLLLEVALVRAAAPETDPSPGGLMGRLERLERRIGIAEQQPQETEVVPAPAPVARRCNEAHTKEEDDPEAGGPEPARQSEPQRRTRCRERARTGTGRDRDAEAAATTVLGSPRTSASLRSRTVGARRSPRWVA